MEVFYVILDEDALAKNILQVFSWKTTPKQKNSGFSAKTVQMDVLSQIILLTCANKTKNVGHHTQKYSKQIQFWLL